MVDKIEDFLYNNEVMELDQGYSNSKELAIKILKFIEDNNMFYCPVENLGNFGKLRTPKGWEPEDEEV